MSFSEAVNSFAKLDPVAGFKALFDKSPEENIRLSIEALRAGTPRPGNEIRKIQAQTQRDGDAEKLTEIAQLMQTLADGAAPDQVFKKIHALVDPEGAESFELDPTTGGKARGAYGSILF